MDDVLDDYIANLLSAREALQKTEAELRRARATWESYDPTPEHKLDLESAQRDHAEACKERDQALHQLRFYLRNFVINLLGEGLRHLDEKAASEDLSCLLDEHEDHSDDDIRKNST